MSRPKSVHCECARDAEWHEHETDPELSLEGSEDEDDY